MDMATPWAIAADDTTPWSRAKPAQAPAPSRPDFADDPDLKIAYGIELAKEPDAFRAALILFKDVVTSSLWASTHWIKDPAVIASRDIYANTLKNNTKPLDKIELLSKVLAFADEKDINGHHLVEAKERLNALKLYSEIQGFTGKVDINASTNTINNTNNLMKITLVKPEVRDAPIKTIEASNIKSEMSNEDLPLIELKLVGGGSR
jgi:hypothetical protein